MNRLSICGALVAADVLCGDSGASAASPTKTSTTSKGLTLTDAKGMSLYTFDKDSGGKSACNSPVRRNWPLLKAEASDQASDNYTIITRDDGGKQWAYKGKPLYTFAKDQKAGDINRRWLPQRRLASRAALTLAQSPGRVSDAQCARASIHSPNAPVKWRQLMLRFLKPSLGTAAFFGARVLFGFFASSLVLAHEAHHQPSEQAVAATISEKSFLQRTRPR